MFLPKSLHPNINLDWEDPITTSTLELSVNMVLKLTLSGGTHNVMLADSGDSCDPIDTLLSDSTNGTTITIQFHTAGIAYFICTRHCSTMKMAITIH
jgi:plastocyanin